jgi:hypothetical protein
MLTNSLRIRITLVITAVLATSFGCSSSNHSAAGTIVVDDHSQPSSVPSNAAPSKKVDGKLDFVLINFTGTELQSVYLSPSTSGGWEENILGSTTFKDGDTLNVRFDPNEKTDKWDMRVEGVDSHYAEWKQLDLRNISEMTLVLKLSKQSVVIAEVE